MTELAPIQLEDGTIIYIEATAGVNAPVVDAGADTGERPLVSKGAVRGLQKRTLQSFQAVEGTIRAYTHYALGAFKQVAIANIDKVTLEFGIKVGGEAGIPYVTKGTAESNLKITVECSFPEQDTPGAGE